MIFGPMVILPSRCLEVFKPQDTVVAKMITELIRFEPEICICNGNLLESQRESVSAVMRDFLLKFQRSVSVMKLILLGARFCNMYLQLEINSPQKKSRSVINLDTTVIISR